MILKSIGDLYKDGARMGDGIKGLKKARVST